MVRSIDVQVVQGRVRPAAFSRQLRLSPGDRFDAAVWEADLRRAFNEGIFRRLDTRVVAFDAAGIDLRVEVVETWSLLPIFGFQDGAVRVIIVGATTADLLGELLGVGGYYMRRDALNLGRAWLRLPHLLGPGSLVQLEAVTTGSLLALYPAPPGALEAAVAQAYPATGRAWRVPRSAGYEILRRGPVLDVGLPPLGGRPQVALRWLVLWETLNALGNLDAVTHAGAQGEPLPELDRRLLREQRLVILAPNLRLGRVDLLDSYRRRGQDLTLVAPLALGALGSERSFEQVWLGWRGFFSLGPRVELALAAAGGGSSSRDPVDQLSLGSDLLDPFTTGTGFPGVLTVRGFAATQLTGATVAYGSAELRYTLAPAVPMWVLGGGALQGAAFVDAGQAWAWPWLGQAQAERPLLSAGAGLLLTLLDLRYAYFNWYVARALSPYRAWTLNVILTRPFL